jgi:hypothetical protein
MWLLQITDPTISPVISPLLEKGILGLIIVSLGIFIWYLLKMAEKRQDKHDTFVNKVQDDMIKVIKENTDVLSGIKSLIESIDRRTK